MNRPKKKVVDIMTQLVVSSGQCDEVLIEKVKALLNKPFGRLLIEKHQNTLYVEETDKQKFELKK